MSSYIQFFMRRGDEFIPLMTYSRSNTIYKIFEHILPWEKIKAISYDSLSAKIAQCNSLVSENEEKVKELNQKKTLVASFNNSVEEKMEALSDIDEAIEEYNEDIAMGNRAAYICIFLQDLIEEIMYDEEPKKYDKDKYIYGGYEVGTPTLEDIEE